MIRAIRAIAKILSRNARPFWRYVFRRNPVIKPNFRQLLAQALKEKNSLIFTPKIYNREIKLPNIIKKPNTMLPKKYIQQMYEKSRTKNILGRFFDAYR